MQNIRVGRFFLVVLAVGVSLGFVSAALSQSLGIAPDADSRAFLGGGLVGGGVVATTVCLNLLIRSGHLTWLRRDGQIDGDA